MQQNTWTHVYDAALNGLVDMLLSEGHGSGLGDGEVGPVIRKVMRAKFAPGDFPVTNPLNNYASLWGKPPLAGSPGADVSEVVVSERDGNSGLGAEIRDDPLGCGLHELCVFVHASSLTIFDNKVKPKWTSFFDMEAN